MRLFLALVALGLLAPEVLLALAPELAGEGAGAGAVADVASDAYVPVDFAGEPIETGEPGYITWAKNVVANGSSYDEDTFNKAEEILYRNKML